MKRKSQFDSTSSEVIDQADQEAVFCAHGPCLLFERSQLGLLENKRFYACSVYRNRKLCNFYRPASERSLKKCVSENCVKDASLHHKNCYNKLKSIRKLTIQKRAYCFSCNVLVLPEELPTHSGHQLKNEITSVQLKNPTKFLTALQDKDGEAYWFSKPSIGVLLSAIQSSKCDGVLCLGCPRLFEVLNSAKCKKSVHSFLLDYDIRLESFWSPRLFARYNMIADYLYTKSGAKHLDRFLSSVSRLIIVVDPPFGALCCQVAKSVRNLRSKFMLCKNLNEQKVADDDIHCIWIAPYFLESKVCGSLPELKMSDYQVEYENHPLYARSDRKRGSPIRLFTSIPLGALKLPEISYRYCQECSKYVVKANVHCSLCKICPSKDGRTYVHCKRCKRCVKPTYLHCQKCGRCHLSGGCQDSLTGNSSKANQPFRSKRQKLICS